MTKQTKRVAPKLVPNLRRLLQEIGACQSGRDYAHEMTLSQLWSNLRQNRRKHPVLSDGSRGAVTYASWAVYLYEGIGLSDGYYFSSFNLFQRQKRAGLKPFDAPYQAPQGWKMPATLPAEVLRKWDGYEPVKRVRK
jgi:hypothetical protein